MIRSFHQSHSTFKYARSLWILRTSYSDCSHVRSCKGCSRRRIWRDRVHLCDPIYNCDPTLGSLFGPPDSHILKRSGLARVTAVARSNYDAIRGEWGSMILSKSVRCYLATWPEHGMNIQSKKYGNISAWRPDRCTWTTRADTSSSYHPTPGSGQVSRRGCG